MEAEELRSALSGSSVALTGLSVSYPYDQNPISRPILTVSLAEEPGQVMRLTLDLGAPWHHGGSNPEPLEGADETARLTARGPFSITCFLPNAATGDDTVVEDVRFESETCSELLRSSGATSLVAP